MSKAQKIKNIILGIVMLICAAILIIDPKDGYTIVLFILEVSLLLTAIKGFIYYFTMARFMVDGRRVLYKNLLLFDLSIFLLAVMDIPSAILVSYIAYVFIFAAAVDIFFAFQAHKIKSPIWYRKLIYGIVELGIAIVSLCFFTNMKVMAYAYAWLLLYNGIIKITETVHKKAIVYVQ